MANIPVERTGGTPWWLWLLGLLLLGLLIWFLIELFDDEDEVEVVDDIGVVDDVAPVVPMEPADGAITSFSELATGTTSVGRQVDLDGMRVISLTGDSSFIMGPSQDPNQAVLVVLQGMNESESLPPPPTGRDGEYNIDVGDVIDVEGTVNAFDESIPDYAEMPAVDRDRVLQDQKYINASNITSGEDTISTDETMESPTP